MPFDAEITEKSRDLIVLEKARESLVRGWVNHCPKESGQHCVVTALFTAAGEKTEELERALRIIGFHWLGSSVCAAAEWNDSPLRTQAEVLARFDEAIERLRAS